MSSTTIRPHGAAKLIAARRIHGPTADSSPCAGLTAVRTARAYGTLVAVIAMINAANRFSVIMRMPGGAYEPGVFGALSD
ncbi:hypothetical protein [Streptomyces sp. GMY02]|uniref:hypothetical protein n=1 Tax=Streptomyces sp. GMY02 TaxID=1333528 RepID=UPI0018F05087|nr:hypothetical protein [Streptomyces sp. GMY02]